MQGGVPKKHWDSLRREVLHTYGHEHILTLTTLQDAGGLLRHHVCMQYAKCSCNEGCVTLHSSRNAMDCLYWQSYVLPVHSVPWRGDVAKLSCMWNATAKMSSLLFDTCIMQVY